MGNVVGGAIGNEAPPGRAGCAAGRSPATMGLVLAAGSGSRLGLGAKALLRSGRATLVERAVSALRSGGCDAVLVVVGAEAEQVTARVLAAGAGVVLNEDWDSGLASSFRQGVAALPDESERMVVTLVDQPAVGPKVVAHLLARHGTGRIAAAQYGGSGPRHPMVFDHALAREAAELAEGDSGAREYLRRHPDLLDLVDCSGLGSVADVDTHQDLHLLEP